MFQRALLGYTRSSYPDTKAKLDLLYNMGVLYRKMQDFDTAKGFFTQAHEGYQRRLGSQHDETIDALEQLNIENKRSTTRAEHSKSRAIDGSEQRNIENERSAQGAEGFKSGTIDASEQLNRENERSTPGAERSKGKTSRFSPARLRRRRHLKRDH